MNITKLVNCSLILRPVTTRKLHSNGLRRVCCGSKDLSLHQNSYLNQIQTKLVSTYEVKNVEKEESFVKKILKKIPFINVKNMQIKARGYILYEEIADKVDYFEFFTEFDLEDTFYSWFAVTELYIWMLSLRAVAEGDEGRVLRNAIIEALWSDVSQRVKKLGSGSPSILRGQIIELSDQLQAAFIAYDEGIQSDDIVLAGALWRRIYKKEHVDPHNLEKLVKCIRKQVALLDLIPTDQLFKQDGSIPLEQIKSN